MRRTATILVLTALVSACGGDAPPKDADVSGAKSAIYTLETLLTGGHTGRPTAPLGVIVSSFLAEGLTRARSALTGIDALFQILKGQKATTSSETFALLQEVGNVLTVNIVDELNRSDNRAVTLDAYLATLRNARDITKRRMEELQAELRELAEKRKELTSERRVARRDTERALRAKEYGAAGALQENVTAIEGKLAEAKAKEEQTEDILKRFEELLGVSEERLEAIERNRAVLLSGLKVVPVPGIEDLMILEENRRYHRRSRRRSGGPLGGV